MGAKSNASAKTAQHELVITRTFDAPRSLVFEMWAKPEHMERWCGPRGFTIPFGEMDFRPGGAWRSCLRSAEGKDHWVRGVYREIVPPARLVFTHAWEDENGQPGHETVVTLIFTEIGKKTKLTLHQAPFESIASRDGHHGGWSETLDRLGDYLVGLARS
jgi:uncharacterized protein YndB with AHSA1/START domain